MDDKVEFRVWIATPRYNSPFVPTTDWMSFEACEDWIKKTFAVTHHSDVHATAKISCAFDLETFLRVHSVPRSL